MSKKFIGYAHVVAGAGEKPGITIDLYNDKNDACAKGLSCEHGLDTDRNPVWKCYFLPLYFSQQGQMTYDAVLKKVTELQNEQKTI